MVRTGWFIIERARASVSEFTEVPHRQSEIEEREARSRVRGRTKTSKNALEMPEEARQTLRALGERARGEARRAKLEERNHEQQEAERRREVVAAWTPQAERVGAFIALVRKEARRARAGAAGVPLLRHATGRSVTEVLAGGPGLTLWHRSSVCGVGVSIEHVFKNTRDLLAALGDHRKPLLCTVLGEIDTMVTDGTVWKAFIEAPELPGPSAP